MKRGHFYPPGASRQRDGLQIVFKAQKGHNIEIAFFGKERLIKTIAVSDIYRQGCVYSVLFEPGDIPVNAIGYRVYFDCEPMRDDYATSVRGMLPYGSPKEAVFSACQTDSFDWGDDVHPGTPFEKTIIYGLHVRGFTKHSSSKIKAKGTFLGITEKLSYLKELGVTAVELMPAYEFDETEKLLTGTDEEPVYRTNYWGFVYPAYYYAPKSAYSYSKDARYEFCQMVKALHSEGIEVIMQFYFPKEMPAGEITDILRFWIAEYHVDGFRLIGFGLPISVIEADPILSYTKIICSPYDHIDRDRLFAGGGERHLAIMNDSFTTDIRRFLKGDEDMLKSVIKDMKENDTLTGVVNAVVTHDGFTLRDLVSYDYKHNEANGEKGSDGNPNNFSWNCGEEGPSRKKSINALRLKQMKNAFALLLLSQGIPYIRAGDEFAQTQQGNNNPFCHDNNITHLDWRLADKYSALRQIVSQLVRLRKEHPVFSRRELLRDMDYKGLGAPDISYHGTELWKVNLGAYYRHMSLYYNGKYAVTEDGSDDSSFFVAMNMHWDPHEFAMPMPDEGCEWELILDTACTEGARAEKPKDEKETEDGEKPGSIIVKERSIHIYASSKTL